MLDLIVIYLTISIILGILIGHASYYVCYGVDRWMDYNGIFYKLRLGKFYKICNKLKYNDLLQKAFNVDKIKDNEKLDIVTHSDYMSELFWTLADRYAPFKLWVCVECMSVRFSLVTSLITTSLFAYIQHDKIYFLMFPVINIGALTIIYKIQANA